MKDRFYPLLYPPADIAVLQGGGKVFGEHFDAHEAAVARAESMYELAVQDGIGQIVLPFVVVADDTGTVVQVYGVEPAGAAEPARAANPGSSKRFAPKKRLRLKADADGYVEVKAGMNLLDVWHALDRLEAKGVKIEGVYYTARGSDYMLQWNDTDFDRGDPGGVTVTVFDKDGVYRFSGGMANWTDDRVIDLVRYARREPYEETP